MSHWPKNSPSITWTMNQPMREVRPHGQTVLLRPFKLQSGHFLSSHGLFVAFSAKQTVSLLHQLLIDNALDVFFVMCYFVFITSLCIQNAALFPVSFESSVHVVFFHHALSRLCSFPFVFLRHRRWPLLSVRPQSFVLRRMRATWTARPLWAAPSALKRAAPSAEATLRSQEPLSSTSQTSAFELWPIFSMSR